MGTWKHHQTVKKKRESGQGLVGRIRRHSVSSTTSTSSSLNRCRGLCGLVTAKAVQRRVIPEESQEDEELVRRSAKRRETAVHRTQNTAKSEALQIGLWRGCEWADESVLQVCGYSLTDYLPCVRLLLMLMMMGLANELSAFPSSPLAHTFPSQSVGLSGAKERSRRLKKKASRSPLPGLAEAAAP